MKRFLILIFLLLGGFVVWKTFPHTPAVQRPGFKFNIAPKPVQGPSVHVTAPENPQGKG